MSSRPRKKPEAVLTRTKAPKEARSHPVGKPPEAMVVARHETGVVTRQGRGFSMGELAEVGLAPRLASRWGLRLDFRRRSVLQGNVTLLKQWGVPAAAEKKAEGRVKKVEEELAKVEKEVEKEVKKGAAEVEKEAAKAEKELKKEALKAGKAVKAKERPKAKAKKKSED